MDHRTRKDSSSPGPASGGKAKKQFDLFVRWEFGRDANTDGLCKHCNEPCGHEITYSWVPDEEVPRAVRDHYWLIHKKFTGKQTEGVEPVQDQAAAAPEEKTAKDQKEAPKCECWLLFVVFAVEWSVFLEWGLTVT